MYISIIVALISAMASFMAIYLSSMKDKFSLKYQIQRERLNLFYIPFYQLYCRGFLFENSLSEMGIEARSKFLDLMSENIALMGCKSQSLYPEFYKAFLNSLEAYSGNPDFPKDVYYKIFDDTFSHLADTIFSEYKHILRKVYLPVPSIKPKRTHL